MSQREYCIVLAHALQCDSCRARLLRESVGVTTGRALTGEEKSALERLTQDDFLSPQHLAEASGISQDELSQYAYHPIVRLRHF